MADNGEEKILINVGLNLSDAEDGIDSFKQKIQDVSKQDLGTSNVQSYKIAIRQLTNELQKIEQVQGRNSAAFREGAAELGRLKEAARDFKTQIEAYDPSNKLAGIANIAKGAAVGLTGAAGAMALFGIKGEKAEEVMLRLQGILALSHAISSIHEVVAGYQAFINVLGLTSTAAQKVASIPTPAIPGKSAVANTTENAVTDTTDNSAEVAGDEAATESQTELNTAKAAGTEITVANQEAEATGTEIVLAKAEALDALTVAQTASNEAVAEGIAATVGAAEANIVQAATTDAVAVAEGGATGMAIGLKVALWAIGIGLLTTAIAYLISNWKEVKQSFLDLFPVLGQTKSTFKDFENVLLGVGDTVLHALKIPLDIVINLLKTAMDLMSGNFVQAAEDVSNGLKQVKDDWNSTISAFSEGQAKGAAKDAEAANKIRVQSEINANERIIKERKALGQDVHSLEIKNQQLKNSLLDKDADDYMKKLADGESEITVLQNQEIKKRLDAAEKLRKEAAEKAAAAKKADLDKLKSGDDEAAKVILEGQRSQRDIELADADFKYQKLIAIANKYGQDASELEEALGITKLRINKKYSDEIALYLEKSDDATLSEFDKKRKQILLEAQAAMKNATPAEKNRIYSNQVYLTGNVDKEEQLSNAKDEADAGVTNAENTNRATVAPEGQGDDPQTAFKKEEAIRKAKLVALQAQYKQEQFLANGNKEKLLAIEAKFNKASKDSDDEATKAKIALAQAEAEAKVKTLEVVSSALGEASDIVGKNTAAGKALAVAQATINTYLSASEAYKSVIGIPYVGPVLAPIAAGVAVAAGLESVKQILSVKVPGASGTDAGQTPSYSAPTINSTVLNQAQQGTQNVNVLNQPDTTKQQPIKAYVVDRDITNAQDRAAYLDRRSTLG